MRFLCDDCRRSQCSKRWKVARETFFAMGDGREVECDEQLLTWEAQLAA